LTAVVASPDPDLEEEVAAFVALKQGAKATGEEIISYCQERLAAFKYPRHVTLLERLPRGATGKVLKSELMKERH
jgi:long-chain acyl-CoA synthetase